MEVISIEAKKRPAVKPKTLVCYIWYALYFAHI